MYFPFFLLYMSKVPKMKAKKSKDNSNKGTGSVFQVTLHAIIYNGTLET